MNDFKIKLFKMINGLLDGKYSVNQFREKYYDYYIEEVPDEVLNENETEYFSSIQEKLDWTSENPSKEDRSYGWIDEKEYVLWVSDLKNKFESK